MMLWQGLGIGAGFAMDAFTRQDNCSWTFSSTVALLCPDEHQAGSVC